MESCKFLIQCIFLSLSFAYFSVSATSEDMCSLENVEKTLEHVLDFIHKTKESNMYNLFHDSSEEEEDKIEEKMERKPKETIPQYNCTFLPSNCADIQQMGFTQNNVYEIYPKMLNYKKAVRVFCDLTTDGGGWTVIQRRGPFIGHKEDFFRNWTDFKNGFGNLRKEFWLGNEYLSILTIQDRVTLRVDLEDYQHNIRYAVFDDFLVEGEYSSFKMNYNKYSGDAGDALAHSKGQHFSTHDRFHQHDCAKKSKGGWWYNNCSYSNLNGLYFNATEKGNQTCVNWYHFRSDYRCMKRTEMKVRPEYIATQKLNSAYWLKMET